MNKIRKIIFTLMFISIFTILTLKFPVINNETQKNKTNEPTKHHKEQPKEKEIVNLDNLKTANPSLESQNFSFDTLLHEEANITWQYENYNVTQGEWPQDYMLKLNVNGYNGTLNFYITDLTNASSPTKDLLNPSDLTNFRLRNYAGIPTGWEDVNTIADEGLGKGSCSSFLRLNKTLGFAAFSLAYGYDGVTNITYNATIKFNVITNHTVSATFKPDLENTQSDFITWEINYDNFFTSNHDTDDYKAVINLDEHFTLSSATARDDTFWRPINISRTDTNLTLYGPFDEYKIQFYSPNYISVVYNDNLTITGNNALNLS